MLGPTKYRCMRIPLARGEYNGSNWCDPVAMLKVKFYLGESMRQRIKGLRYSILTYTNSCLRYSKNESSSDSTRERGNVRQRRKT